MTASLRRRTAGYGLVLAVCAAMATAPNGAAGGSRAAGGDQLYRAVVALADSGPVTAPGVRVEAVLSHVRAEVVTATAAGLRALASSARVLGISSDARMTVSGKSYGGDGGVLAAQTVGGQAGTPDAGRGVNVALLDTGVSDTAALNRASGRITDGVDVSRLAEGGPALTSGQFTDGFGHGTFLASLIAGGKVAASGNRTVGVAPAARVVVVKVGDDQGTTNLSEVLAGFDWVAAHAVAPNGTRMIQVLNVALAVERPTAPVYGADPLTAAVEHVRSKGVLVVAAAGNDPDQVGDPGMSPRALTVGAADVTGDNPGVADFSGSGVVAGVRKPDLVAAGVHVLGVMPEAAAISQQFPGGRQGNGLFRGSGTSEATAITSGAAAIFLSRHRDATPLEAKASLRAAAKPLAGDRDGAGLLQAPGRMVPLHGADASDGPVLAPDGSDVTGEASFEASSWSGNAWEGGDWAETLASSWSASSWSASSWSASSWSASSWSASSWSASSWSASSWSASSWSASSWSASSWSASSWSASSWSASSWSAASWGDDA